MYLGVNMVYKAISLFSLPTDSTYVLISPKLREHLRLVVAKNGGIYRTSKLLDIKPQYFYRLSKGKRCSLQFLFKIHTILGVDAQIIEQNILEISSGKNNSIGIKNPKLPFDLDNPQGGVLLGGIMGDGSRTKLGGLIYNNNQELLVNLVLNSAKLVFGDIDNRRTWKKDGTLQLDLPKISGDVVGMFGIEKSYKTVSDCFVNLEEFSSDFKISFIRQFFNDEGNVRRSDRRVQVKQTRITSEKDKVKIRKNICFYAPRVLLSIKKELEKIGIKSTISLETIRNKNNVIKGDFALNIYGKENLELFKEKINFDIAKKIELIDEVIGNYKFPSAPRNGRIAFALEKAKMVQDKYGFVTKHALAAECNRSLKTATYFLVDLKKRGLVQITDEPRDHGRPLPKKYVLMR